MTDEAKGSSAERKKARRRARKDAEAAGGRDLESITDAAVEQAIALAPQIAVATEPHERERVLDVVLETVDAARFVRKRVNEALGFDEWLDEVEVWVWEYELHTREPLSDAGREFGVEIRLERR